MKRKASLALVLAVAATLRLWGLDQASFFHYDEGQIAKSALGPAVAVRWLIGAAWMGEAVSRNSLRAAYDRTGTPYVNTSPRPGFQFLAVLSMTLFGARDIALIALSAAAGVGTVWTVHRLLARIGPDGLLPFWGAIALAVSPNHVFFSRTAFAHATAAFFLVWSGWLYLAALADGRRIPAFRTGLCLGYAFTCHFNVATAVAAFFLFDAWRRWRDRRDGKEGWIRSWLSETARAGAGFLAPILAFQGASLLAAARLPAVLTYFQELAAQREHLLEYCNARATSATAFYGIHWLRTEGIGLAAGTLAGAALCLARWRDRSPGARAGLLALCLTAIPLLSASLLDWKVARTLVLLFPFGAMLWGVAFSHWRPPGNAGRILKGILAAAALLPPLWTSAGYLAGHGHFRERVRTLQSEGRQVFAIDEDPAVDFYAARRQDVLVHSWEDQERILVQTGRPGAVIALWKDGRYGFDDPVYANRYGFLREVVARKGKPDRVFPFRVPLAYEYVDPAFRWDRLLFLDGVRYELHVFLLDRP